MTKATVRQIGGGRRLKGLDEFTAPAFAGRMARFARRRKAAWWMMIAGAVSVGGSIGWLLF